MPAPQRRAGRRDDDRDVGFFGPGSVSWRLHADPLTGLAGLVAVLLQDLHPVSAAAAAEEGASTWTRVERAAAVLGTTTYGSRMAAMTCAARLRAEAGMVAGFDTETDRIFRGDDPDVLAWRHSCGVLARILVARAAEVELTDADADTYVGEQLTAALLLGLEPDEVPATVAALDEAVDAARPRLRPAPGGRATWRRGSCARGRRRR
ncbi:oxygenase MpaB family protein, partial [Kineococcus glutinatus]|uniref:oxygenase MpaB family protein n=1 Tax=Kineococcus glutinatus TaxID=1070872 RepID=UPI0031E88E1C